MAENKPKEIVEVFRLLRYVGPKDWVDKQIANRAVKGTHIIGQTSDKTYIEESVLGDYKQIVLNRKEKKPNGKG